MIKDIAYTMILGVPLVLIGGIIVFLLLLTTASIPILNQKKLTRIPIKYHIWLARATIILGLVHGTLAASLFLGF